jgi:hypothetical protein
MYISNLNLHFRRHPTGGSIPHPSDLKTLNFMKTEKKIRLVRQRNDAEALRCAAIPLAWIRVTKIAATSERVADIVRAD